MRRLSPYFPKSHGKPRFEDRRVLSGIIFANRNGLCWRDAPWEYGPHTTLYNRWKQWGGMGVFVGTMEGLSALMAEPQTVQLPFRPDITVTRGKSGGGASAMDGWPFE